jgi:beta-glucuronidase
VHQNSSKNRICPTGALKHFSAPFFYVMRPLIFISLWALLSHLSLRAEEPNPATRRVVSLNGKWEVILDPYTRNDNSKTNQVYRNDVSDDLTRRIEYRFTPEHTLDVPGDWNTQDERLFLYEGNGLVS